MNRLPRMLDALLGVALIGFVSIAIVCARAPGRVLDHFVVVVAIAGSLACLASYRARDAIRSRVALGAISTLFALFLAEMSIALLLTWSPPVSSRIDLAKRLGVPFDARTNLEVIEDLGRQGTFAVPHFYPCDWLRTGREPDHGGVFPLAGVSSVTTVYGNEGGSHLIYRSDPHGFNNPPSVWESGTVDIALIGDSFTAGAYVDPSSNIAGVLRAEGRAPINLGIGCSGPLLYLARLKEYAAVLKPRRVAWIYYEGNDLAELEDEKKSASLTAYLADGHSQGLFGRQAEIDRSLIPYLEGARIAAWAARRRAAEQPSRALNSLTARILRLWHLRGLHEQITAYHFDPYFEPEQRDPDIELFGRILAAARRTTEAWGGEFWFVYLPETHRYSTAVDRDGFHSRRRVLAEVARQDIRTIDIHAALGELEDPLDVFPLRVSGHYSERGYRIVAEQILQQAFRDD